MTKIDAADLRCALGTCMRDTILQTLYKSAPEGAKPVLKTLFYAAVFPEKIDREGLWSVLEGMKDDLSNEDLEYLIENWEGRELQEYFAGILQARKSSKQKLCIRRAEAHVESAVDLNAEAVKRRIEMEAEEAAASAQAENLAWRRARREEFMRKSLVTLVVGCVLAGGGIWFLSWKKERDIRREARRVEFEKIRAEEEARDKIEWIKEKEKREAAAAERKREIEARQEKEKELREAQERKYAERRKEEELRKSWRKKFDDVRSSFKGASLSSWRTLPSSNRPGAVDAVFTCVMCEKDGENCFYEINSKSSGEINVVRLNRDSAPEEVDFNEWNETLRNSGGIVGNESKTYLFLSKMDDERLTEEDIQPAEIRLGKLYDVIRTFNMDVSGFSFTLEVNLKGKKAPLTFKPVEFYETVYLYEVRNRIMAAVKASVKKPKPRTRRLTVKMYNGQIVKKQMNGIILVPHNPINPDSRYYELRDEALRQQNENNRIPPEEIERYNREVAKEAEKAFETCTMTVSVKCR